MYVLRNRQILFRKSHCTISKWRKSAVLSKSLLTMLLSRVFISVVKCDGGLLRKLFHFSGDLKRSDVFCSASSAREWGSRSSGSRSVYTGDFSNLSKNVEVHKDASPRTWNHGSWNLCGTSRAEPCCSWETWSCLTTHFSRCIQRAITLLLRIVTMSVNFYYRILLIFLVRQLQKVGQNHFWLKTFLFIREKTF